MLRSSLVDSNVNLRWKQRKNKELATRSLARSTLGVEGRAGVPGWGLGKVTNINYSHGRTQIKLQFGQCIVWALLVLGRATSKLGLTRLTIAQTWGTHHFPPYSIFYASPWGPHPNGILSRHSQMGVPKFPKLGLPRVWGPITLCVDLQLKWGLKQSCSPFQELFKGMPHATCTKGNRGDFWLLVVGSQIVNLPPDLSIGHNLCFKCPNGSCEPILDI
jgi:hypothetical protein